MPALGVNPTRTGLVRVLRAMGARIEFVDDDSFLDEPVAGLTVKSSGLRAVSVGREIVPSLIDELPVLAVVATQACGETIVTGAEELRHKESDRIASIVDNLRRMDADIDARDDGFVVRGPTRLTGARVSSFGDHRIAMAMAVAGLLANGETEISDSGVVDVSYPGFFDDLLSLVRLDVQ